MGVTLSGLSCTVLHESMHLPEAKWLVKLHVDRHEGTTTSRPPARQPWLL